MAFDDTWNAAFEAAPADTDNIAEGAERIRDTRINIRQRLATDHYMDIAGTDADHGEHVKVTLRTGAAAALHADAVVIYAKDVSAKAHPFYIDEDGTERRIEAFPSGTHMLFYQDTAPLGWTIHDTLDDKLVFVTKGSGAGGQTGGGAHSTGTWALTGLNTGSVTLTAAQSGLVAHTHTTRHTQYGGGTPAYAALTGVASGYDTDIATAANAAAAATSGHAHTIAAADTWRPAAYCCIIAAKD